jgi:dienelactone hydrolase
MVRFWYPSAPNANCRLSEYASPKVWAYLSQLSGFPLPNVTTHSCLNAIIAEGSHPVLIFSHGYTGSFTDSTFLFEDLASRGYFVVSIAHTYESTAVEFPDGRLIKSVFGSYLDGDSLRTDEQSLRLARSVRLADLKFVFDELQRLNRSGGFVAGKLDLARAGVMGHSLGGEVALFSLLRDPRWRAALVIDSPITDEDSAGTSKPVLIVTAGRERWNEQECRLWRNLHGPRLSVNLPGAGHLTPTDAIWMFPDVPGLIAARTMRPEKIVGGLRELAAGFFDTHLRGAVHTPATPYLSSYRDALVNNQSESLCRERRTVVRGELP